MAIYLAKKSAAGVEDEATRQLSIACQCETAQGFLISRPLPAEEIERWLSHPVWRPAGQAAAAAALRPPQKS